MGDIAEIIGRLEKLSGPDRAVDRAIRDTLDLPSMLVPPDGGDEAHEYTASIDAALTLVPEGYIWRIDGVPDLWVCVGRPSDKGGFSASRGKFVAYKNANPAIALCIAALRAREKQ